MQQVKQQVRVLPYKMGSKGATLLAEGLRGAGTRCFKVFPNKQYKPRQAHTIINWGSGSTPQWIIDYGNRFPFAQLNILNWPAKVGAASNKLTAFRLMQEAGVSIPEFTTDRETAGNWINDGVTVVARSKLQGHSGDGIIICSLENSEWPRVPLYVKYIKKKHEYRVHVFNGEVIDIQQKRKKQEVANEEVDYQVRNHANGWVYCRDNLNPPPSVLSDATSAVAALGLDFGAVDIIWNEHQSTSYVLEVNTAPGLEGTTLTKYVEAIKGVM